ncbi:MULTISPECIES: hypothetical protein [unclassified Nostoc]|nr:hypothetical protein [Nostoc sp. S13]MDF5735094.1 hypothetical protein [Nostoc sp. S13]
MPQLTLVGWFARNHVYLAQQRGIQCDRCKLMSPRVPAFWKPMT